MKVKVKTPLLEVNLAEVEVRFGSPENGQPTDPYRAKAAKIFMTEESKVTEKQRLYAKQLMYKERYGGR